MSDEPNPIITWNVWVNGEWAGTVMAAKAMSTRYEIVDEDVHACFAAVTQFSLPAGAVFRVEPRPSYSLYPKRGDRL